MRGQRPRLQQTCFSREQEPRHGNIECVSRALLTPLVLFVALVLPFEAIAQVAEGELRVTVQDPDGRPVSARVELVGRNPDFRAVADTDASGEVRLQR